MKALVKVTTKDGTKYILDMHQMQAATGYLQQATKEELEMEMLRAEAAAKKATKQYAPGTYGKFVEEYKTYHPQASQEEIDKRFFGKEKTAKQKDIEAAQEATTELVDKFGGEDKFFKTDFTKRENLTKAYPELVKIEKLEGVEFSNTEKKDIQDIRTLIALSDPAKKLTEKDTGIIDSKLKEVKKYISDSVEGVEATAAYNTFRNSIRHALYGSALTDAEIRSFNEAFGTLGNQLGPVLAQFKTSLNQIKAKLESIQSMKNPYSAYIRLGVDSKKLNNIIQSIDERIQYLDKAESGQGEKPKRRSLEDIL